MAAVAERGGGHLHRGTERAPERAAAAGNLGWDATLFKETTLDGNADRRDGDASAEAVPFKRHLSSLNLPSVASSSSVAQVQTHTGRAH